MKILLASFALFALIAPSTSHALVTSSAECTTADHSLNVSVVNNLGTGLDRSSTLTASIEDSQGNLIATIPVEIYHGVSSASFGRPTYIDIATQGETLVMQGPSINSHNYIMRYTTGSRTISDENLSCFRFMGQTY